MRPCAAQYVWHGAFSVACIVVKPRRKPLFFPDFSSPFCPYPVSQTRVVAGFLHAAVALREREKIRKQKRGYMPAALVPVAVHPVSDGLYGCEKKRKWMGGRSRKSKLLDWDMLNEFVILAFKGGVT